MSVTGFGPSNRVWCRLRRSRVRIAPYFSDRLDLWSALWVKTRRSVVELHLDGRQRKCWCNRQHFWMRYPEVGWRRSKKFFMEVSLWWDLLGFKIAEFCVSEHEGDLALPTSKPPAPSQPRK